VTLPSLTDDRSRRARVAAQTAENGHDKQELTMTRLSTFNSLAALTLTLVSSLAVANPSNKWRLQFSGSADSDGVITLRLSPVGGTPLTASINVTDGTRENMVARTVVEQLRALLPEDAFHVERDDGEDVLIQKRRGAANFDLEILSNDVRGVRINPDRE